MAAKRATAKRAPKRAEAETAELIDEDDVASAVDTEIVRMTDWGRIGSAFVMFVLATPVFTIVAGLFISVAAIGCAVIAAIIFVFWMIAHARGVVFDLSAQELKFPRSIIRSTVSLPEIHDANCEVVYRGLLNDLIGAFADSKKKTKQKPVRQYAVNLSGEFGTRQLRFGSKKRRDQFLSALRRLVPTCRITRWT